MSRATLPHLNPKARERASVILQVRSGQITASQGAKLLGVSRKTYYQWEKRALEAMMNSLQELEPGRPRKKVDPALQAMESRVETLESQLKTASQTAQLRATLSKLRQDGGKPPAKKKPKSSRRSST